ncbi:MAG TPA: DinB family protein [Pyrinomonadaceae bacterium]
MTGSSIGRPDAAEYVPYYHKYVSLVPDGEITGLLSRQMDETLALLAKVSEEQAGFRYAPDKWSIKELVGHLIDSERIFAYRALRFARNDKTSLPGYEQDDYVREASFDERSLRDLAAEFSDVRRATLSLFENLGEAAWGRSGAANDSAVSVRALAYIIAGHELHHVGILRDRYLPSL